MTSANSEIRATYDYEDAKEIVNNGCESGVCFKHIYYADTIGFFNKYPDEITSYIVDTIGIDFMKETLERHNGELNGYLNDLTWAFIELVAGEIVDEHESTTCEELDDEPIKLYADYSKSDTELLQKNGFNPVNSNLSKATLMAMNAIL
jgi:hypothetical protein